MFGTKKEKTNKVATIGALLVAVDEFDTIQSRLEDMATGHAQLEGTVKAATIMEEAGVTNKIATGLLSSNFEQSMIMAGASNAKEVTKPITESSDTEFEKVVTIKEAATDAVKKAWEYFKSLIATAVDKIVNAYRTVRGFLKQLKSRQEKVIKALDELGDIDTSNVKLENDKKYQERVKALAVFASASGDWVRELPKNFKSIYEVGDSITDSLTEVIMGKKNSVDPLKGIPALTNKLVKEFAKMSSDRSVIDILNEANEVYIAATTGKMVSFIAISPKGKIKFAKFSIDKSIIEEIVKRKNDVIPTPKEIKAILEEISNLKVTDDTSNFDKINAAIKDIETRSAEKGLTVDDKVKILAQKHILRIASPVLTKLAREKVSGIAMIHEETIYLAEYFLSVFKANQKDKDKKDIGESDYSALFKTI